MLNATEIRDVKFSKSMNGYKQDEVDVFLDKIEADYVQYNRIITDFQEKIESQNTEIAQLKDSQSSIQSVLLSAQRLADSIVAEAKEKSEEIIKNAELNIAAITKKEQELSEAFEIKAKERKAEIEREMEKTVSEAQEKAKLITAAAEESVARQQMLFDKLKIEIAGFKATVTGKYKEHLEILSTIPDTVPEDPEYMAKVAMDDFKKRPIVSSDEVTKPDEEIISDDMQDESAGFKVEEFEDELI